MKKIELGLLFYKDGVEKLEIESDKNGNRPITKEFENIDKNQASILYDKTKSWNRFIKNGNKLSIISYKESEDFLSMNYDEYLLEDLISKLVRVKYGNVFNMGNERRIR